MAEVLIRAGLVNSAPLPEATGLLGSVCLDSGRLG